MPLEFAWWTLAVGWGTGVLIVHALTLIHWARAWHLASQQPADDEAVHPPPFTVVIPARNEALRLPNLLDDLANQDRQVGIVVIDDHSEDQTMEVARRHPLTSQGLLQVVSALKPGKKSALLEAMKVVSTDWVVTVDADARLGNRWSQTWSNRLSTVTPSVAAVAGPVVLAAQPLPRRFWESIQALDYAAQMGWTVGRLAQHRPGSASGANLALRVNVYPDTRSLGPSGDDTLVVQALRRGGHDVQWLHNVQALVWAPGARDVSEWIGQRLRWATKSKHYPWDAQKTAWWMAFVSMSQVILMAIAVFTAGWLGAGVAMMGWMMIVAMNVRFVRPVAHWFGLRPTVWAWIGLGVTQPFQFPVLAMARLGAFSTLGISSNPIWKGRTCTT